MPELPEVEFASRHLRRWLEGRTIVEVEARPSRVVKPSAAAVIRGLRGHQLVDLTRRAKYLLFTFDGGVGAISHLGMTGKWLRRQAGEKVTNSRLQLLLDDGSVLHYRDPRMFGQFALHPAEKLREVPAIAALGPDPLAEGLTPTQLGERLARTARPVKVALLDQKVVAGLGNIQAAEALYRARVHPALPADQLSAEEIRRLTGAIHASIAHTLKAQAHPDEIAYVEEGGKNPFRVYGRAGERCRRCGRRFATLPQAGRTTFFCPGCQR
jgi:formamidopyrimidine-DNA glycosylase